MTATGPPVKKRSHKIYVLWGVALTLLISTALFCWLVVVPVWQVRSAVTKWAEEERPSMPLHVLHTRQAEAIRRLGGPERMSERLTMYLRMPRFLAPHPFAAVEMLGACGEHGSATLEVLIKDEDKNIRKAAEHALRMIELDRIGLPAE